MSEMHGFIERRGGANLELLEKLMDRLGIDVPPPYLFFQEHALIEVCTDFFIARLEEHIALKTSFISYAKKAFQTRVKFNSR